MGHIDEDFDYFNQQITHNLAKSYTQGASQEELDSLRARLDLGATEDGADIAEKLPAPSLFGNFTQSSSAKKARENRERLYRQDTAALRAIMETGAALQADPNLDRGPDLPSDYWDNVSFVSTGPGTITGVLASDADKQKQNKKDYLYEYSRLDRGEEALVRNFGRMVHKNKEVMDPEQATEYARALGVDIKFSEPISKYAVEQEVFMKSRRDFVEKGLQSTSPYVKMDAALLGATIAGGMGPAELATTLALSAVAPALVAKTVSGSASLTKTLLGLKKVEDAARDVERLKTAAKISETIKNARAATGAADASKILSSATGNALKIEKAVKAEALLPKAERDLKLAKTLEKLEGWDAKNLSTFGQYMADAAAYITGDLPFIQSSYIQSRDLDLNTYNEKDRAADALLAFGLGVTLPLGVRGISRMFRSPAAVMQKHIADQRVEIRAKKALGEISEESYKNQSKALDDLEAGLGPAIKDMDKAVDPRLIEMADDIAKANITDEQLVTWTTQINQALINGRIPKLSELTQFESILSHIDNRVLQTLKTTPIAEAMGKSITRIPSKFGAMRLQIAGETGLLGSRAVAGLNEKEAMDMMELMYKGYILHDEAALADFKDRAYRLDGFIKAVTDIAERDKQNIRAKGVKAVDQVDKYSELREQFMWYKLGDEQFAEGIEKELQHRSAQRVGVGELQDFSDEWKEAAAEFEEWYGKWVKVNEKKGFQDFINPETGKQDFGDAFNEYIDDLRQGSQDLNFLADADNVLNGLNEEQLARAMEDMMHLETTADTDVLKLMGIDRVSYADLTDLSKRTLDADTRLSVNRIGYAAMEADEMYDSARESLNALDRQNPEKRTEWGRDNEAIKVIREYRQEGYTQLQADIAESLMNSEAIQETVRKAVNQAPGALAEKGSNKAKRSIKFALQDTIKEAIDKTPVAKYLSPTQKNEMVRVTVDTFMEKANKDPRILMGILNKESLKDVTKLATAESEDLEKFIEDVPGRSEATARVAASRVAMMSPLLDSMDYSLSLIESQKLNNLRIHLASMYNMMEHPEYAGEVFTGKASQTIYSWNGSGLSVEYQAKTATHYVNDIKNKLNEAKTTDGKELMSVWKQAREKTPQGQKLRQDIYKALIYRERGLEYTDNADIARIAGIISDENATTLSMFRDIGSDYVMPMSPIDRSKLKYLDAMIDPEDADAAISRCLNSLAVDVDTMVESLDTGAARMKRNGSGWVVVDKKKKAEIKSWLEKAQGSLKAIQKLTDSSQYKTAVIVLRDADLDHMFNKDGNAFISLNDLRDALLNGTLTDLVNGDLYRLKKICDGVTLLKDTIVGRTYTKGGGQQWAQGYVQQLRAGLGNLGAIHTGRKSAALEYFEGGLRFKDAETELKMAYGLGYDDLEKWVQKTYNDTFQAFYALREFGTNPVDTVDEVIAAYNNAVLNNRPFRDKITAIAASVGKDPEKFLREQAPISEGAKKSIKQNMMMAAGLINQAASTPAKLVATLRNALSASLLMSAGPKSYADYATIWAGLANNAFVDGRGEAFGAVCKAVRLLSRNKDALQFTLASTVMEGEDLLRRMTNDPSFSLTKASAEFSPLDKSAEAVNKMQNILMNNIGQMENITNKTKSTAALGISMAVGKKSDIAYEALSDQLKQTLLREGITGEDWEFIRKYMVHDIADYVADKKVNAKDSFKMLIPSSVMDLTDETLELELKRRGVQNINSRVVKEFRESLLTKTWTMVDAGAEEMISIPSIRTQNILHGGNPRNSGMGIVFDVLTQYQSFGASVLVNTYGRLLGNFASREVGVSAIDLFNPHVRLKNATRTDVFGSLLGTFIGIATWTGIVNSIVSAAKGQIQKPIDENGFHPDFLLATLTDSMGTLGVVTNALVEASIGSGQRGGGISLQVAPSVSNATRTIYRLRKPLASEQVEEKGEAFGGAFAQELGRYSGLKTAPLYGLVWQGLIGAWLDQQIAGGPDNYDRQLRKRAKEGYVLMPWEEYHDDTPTGWVDDWMDDLLQ